ncbi:type II secretion system minor pseudopilin GspK [Pelomonas sp. SE-A7]|uniref:type II secretion system minor pseudopilin GspK n=1 Tax=Pelomonas sp. SE-A7 TaxID=3054953 RepID=UPI00259C884C|nr:type II secretion system minor pseudopilin GspK [Pelomonas sp. SE-A7]MDM4766426.1 type II secretion system minor pseudopilin GspK [Pelomonas sp. SE-A7]
MSKNDRRQSGAALLTAMIIVSLIATLAAAMAWRQYRALRVEEAERVRAQSAWILQGALDWARLILREDARANQQGDAVDHLGEVWAVPLAEARLSTFLAAEQDSSIDAGPEAFLSGKLSDAQAHYNLRNLVGGDQVPPAELRTLERLCELAGAAPGSAVLIAQSLRAANSAKPETATSPVAPRSLDQLTWLELPRDTIQRLRPFVDLLPVPTPVNLNTAPREVIASLFDGMDLASAERLVQSRQIQPLRSLDDAKKLLPAAVVVAGDRASVNSSFFSVSGRLRLDERVLEERSLVQRNGLDMVVLSRERVNLLLEPVRP